MKVIVSVSFCALSCGLAARGASFYEEFLFFLKLDQLVSKHTEGKTSVLQTYKFERAHLGLKNGALCCANRPLKLKEPNFY